MSRKVLTPYEAHVIEKKGTERPFSGQYVYTLTPGTYHCKKCGTALYESQHKFLSDCGWPSFDDEIPGAVQRKADSDGERTEILCAACGGHLGHVFTGEQLTDKNVRHCVNSVSLHFHPKAIAETQEIILASGCFWGTQYYLGRIPGVLSTTVGYCGGQVEHPTYKEVCKGTTGHLEAVLVRFDPNQVSLLEILKFFFETHDFTQKDGQGPDIGPQYLSAAFYGNEEEKTAIEGVLAELRQLSYTPATKVLAKARFWPAEDYHQEYYESKGETPYCHRYRAIFPRAKQKS